MIDLRYLRDGDMIRVNRDGHFHYGFVVNARNESERFPEREVLYLPCVVPGTSYPSIAPNTMHCLRREITGVWHADAQTKRLHPQGASAYDEWASQINQEGTP